jgi:hypothetical protein
MPRLKEALANSGAGSVAPVGQRQMVTLRAKTPLPNEVLIHPLGTLTVKQNVVPLNLDISTFGQAAPAGARRFTIGVSLGGQNQTPQTITDFFAPAQFFKMTDDEKLSRPSFELMAAGVGFGSNDVAFTAVAGDWLEVKAIEFETWIVEENKEPRLSNPENPNVRYELSKELMDRQSRFGAAANSDLRRTGNAKYRVSTTGKHTIAREGWSVVATDDLNVRPVAGIQAGQPTNYSEAAQALRRLKQENPAQARGLKILRLSELSQH